MPKSPHLELFSLGQEFALVIPRPVINQANSILYNGASENDLVGFASIVSNELTRFRDFWDQPTSRTWTLMLLTGGGLAIYLLCRKKCEEENIYVSGINTESRHLPPPRGQYNRWGTRGWFGWFFDFIGDHSDPPTVLGGHYFGPMVGPSTDPRQLINSGFVRNIDPRFILAPCPNCLKGCCKIKRHRKPQYLIGFGDSNTSSSSTSPMRAQGFGVFPTASTPDLADDEDSDVESEGVLQRVSNMQRFNEKLGTPVPVDRIAGDGEHVHRRHSSVGRKSSERTKHRIPPEGREKLSSPSKRSNSSKNNSGANLSCGDKTCTDSFCRSQMIRNNNSLTKMVSNNDRETSVESIATFVDPKYSKGMVGLIRGAREVRRLIREASFDSTASEFSLGVSISEEICEIDKHLGRSRLKVGSICGSDMDSIQDIREEDVLCSESEESQLDFRILQQKCASTHKQKRLWRLSAPLYNSDFDSPEHRNKTVLEESTGSYNSPVHEWQDQKLPKYKMALYGGGSKTHSSSVSEISEAVDGLEWDTEDFAPQFDDVSSELSFCVDSWLEDNMELDLEAELSRLTSERSSRRNSFSSDLDSTYLYRSIRLPPSGRSSVTRGICGGDSSSCETPQKSIDSEMLIRSFGVLPTTPLNDHNRPSHISLMKRSVTTSSLKSPGYSNYPKWKESSPIFDCSSRRHFSTHHDPTTVTMSNTGCLLATTPLSPVHEAKEPRQNSRSELLLSPTNDDSSNDLLKMSQTNRRIFRDNSNCALPDLEKIVQ